MSVGAVVREAAPPRRYGPPAETWQAPDARRLLQLGLAAHLAAGRAPQALHDMISGMASGEDFGTIFTWATC